jgi:hypothetical protein
VNSQGYPSSSSSISDRSVRNGSQLKEMLELRLFILKATPKEESGECANIVRNVTGDALLHLDIISFPNYIPFHHSFLLEIPRIKIPIESGRRGIASTIWNISK